MLVLYNDSSEAKTCTNYTM
jgi:hypothetical protein